LAAILAIQTLQPTAIANEV